MHTHPEMTRLLTIERQADIKRSVHRPRPRHLVRGADRQARRSPVRARTATPIRFLWGSLRRLTVTPSAGGGPPRGR